jgi:peptide/nickel transport system ATP-binding protein
VVERGTARALFEDPWHPYTWGLLGSIPPLAGPRPRRLPSIAGTPPSLHALPPGCAFAPRCACALPACASARPALTAADVGLGTGEEAHAVACIVAPEARAAARITCRLAEPAP